MESCLSGISILPVAFYLKICGKEHHPNEGEYDTEDNDNNNEGGIPDPLSESQRKHPLREATRRENWPALVSSILVPMLYGGGYYISVVWMTIYMDKLVVPPVPGSFWINLVSNIFGLTLTSFAAGWLSDIYGRVKMMTVSSSPVSASLLYNALNVLASTYSHILLLSLGPLAVG